jgi:hypothetical protein
VTESGELLGDINTGLRTHRRPRRSLQGTEGYWASILQLTPSAIARKASNGAGSGVVQSGLSTKRAQRIHGASAQWQCGLTPRSSGAPTAGHQARSGGTRYIFASPGLASCRWRPLSSNVRQHKRVPWRANRVSACRRVLNSHE